MPFIPSPRLTNLGLFLATVVAMLFALWLQHYQHLEPCPLCIFQRVAMMATGAVALLAFVHGPGITGRRVYAGLTLLAAAAGIAVAGRHVWLQHLPPEQVPPCGPDLYYMLGHFPLARVLEKLFAGSGQCAEVHWRFLGLSIAEWSLGWFLVLALYAVWLAARLRAAARAAA